MNKMVEKIIKRVYLERDRKFYLDKCLGEIHLPFEFFDLFTADHIDVIGKFEFAKVYPSVRGIVGFRNKGKGEFRAEIRTIIYISKLGPFFYLRHEFEVENRLPNRIQPTLDGFGNRGYIQEQHDFHLNVAKILMGQGFIELSYLEFNEVICGINFPSNISIFGSQVTIEYALFHDLLELCPI